MKHRQQPRLAAALVLGSLIFGAPAASAQETMQDAQRQAVEGIGKLLQALQMFVKSVPQYSAPEVLPNGDIIIRRVKPDKAPAPQEEKLEKDDDDTTST
jgi:hypothetical protein